MLEDSQNGWKALCQDLKQVDNIPEGKTCSDMCKEDLWCSEWALVKNWKGEEQCWAGLGDRCYKTHGYEGQLVQAQRIMHGHHRVLRDLRFAEVDGLVYVDVTNDGGITATAQADGAQRCKNTCLSLVNCQIWIYHKSSGCWIEWPYKHRVQYPATAASWGIARSQDVVAGEYMQRVCGDLSGTPGVAPAPPPLPNQPITPGAPLPTVCETNNKAPLTAACQCASNVDGNECMPGMYCWEGNTCASSPKPDRTLPDEDDDEIIPVASNGSDWEKIVVVVLLLALIIVCCGLAGAGLMFMVMGSKSRASASTLQLSEVDDERDEAESNGKEANFTHAAPGFVSRAVPLLPTTTATAYAPFANQPRGQQPPQVAYTPLATSSSVSRQSTPMVEVPAGTPGAMPMMDNGSGRLVALPTGLPTLRLGGARDMRDPGPPKVCRNCGNVFMPDAVFCRRCGEPRSVFDMIDTNHDGFITPEEWKRFGMEP